MQIRVIGPGQLDALLNLYRHLNPSDQPLPARSRVEAIWHEIQSNPRMQCFGGFVGTDLVSTCTLSVIANLTRGCRSYGLIENVVTHADHRQRGYGRKLLAHALDWAWVQGCYKVMLLTSRKDAGITLFYEKAGFNKNEKNAFVARPVA